MYKHKRKTKKNKKKNTIKKYGKNSKRTARIILKNQTNYKINHNRDLNIFKMRAV